MYTSENFRKKFTGRKPQIQGVRGRFSVLVPVVDIGGEAHFLYELRSSHIDRQPGEVCFPGGEIEPGETPRQAVIRETWEEIGLRLSNQDIIADLDILHPPSNIVIYPFLGILDPHALDHLNLSECEVAECFTVPVSFLMSEPYTYRYSIRHDLGDDFQYEKIGLKERSYRWHSMEQEIISWEYEGKYIWGLTASITRWTLDILNDGSEKPEGLAFARNPNPKSESKILRF